VLREQLDVTATVPVLGPAAGRQAWVAVEVTAPTAFARAVVRALTARGGQGVARIPDPDRPDASTVRGELPEAELIGWAAALHDATLGTGRARRRPLGDRPA